MTYRDDHAALQNRVEQLEQELADARRQGEEHGREAAQARTRELEQQIESLQRDLTRIGGELRAMRGGAKPSGRRATIIAGLAVTVGLMATGAAMMLASKPQPPKETVVTAPPSPPAIDPTPAEPPLEPTPPPTPEPPPQPAQPAQPKAPAEARTAHPRWRAVVRRAEGLPFAPGSTCTIDATVETTHTNTRVPDLLVTCSGQKVYSKKDPFDGMAKLDNDARERLGPRDDRSTFTLQYNDIGTRTGARSQIDLDSNRREGAVFRDAIPRFRIELTIPVESEPTAPLAGAAQRLRREGKIAEVSGATPLKVGAACLARAMPTGQGESCVAEVTCGATTLIPTSAPVRCTYDGARPIGVESTGGPRSISLGGSSLEVKAEGAGAFRALVSLDDR